jgi:hypothetical protein
MTENREPTATEAFLLPAGVRRLIPDTTTIFEGTFSLLHCSVKNDQLYRGVFAVRMFPIHFPERFISLHYTDLHDKDREIGVIENLKIFPEDQQHLVRWSLAAHYYEQEIRRINRVTLEYGLLFFEVETQRGEETFVMPWRGDRAEDYGDKGKVLLDAMDNRYIIPDVEALPTADRRRFTGFIYW